MHYIETLGKTFTAPENWDEITLQQALFLIRLMNSGKEYDEVMFRLAVEFFRLPTGELTRFKYSRKNRYRDYCADLLTATEPLFEFLFEKKGQKTVQTQPETQEVNPPPSEEQEEVLVIAKKLTRQLLPEHNGLYGPSAGLSNVKIWEFTMAETAFMEIVETKNRTSQIANRTSLDKLIATLYRPMRSDGEAWRASDSYDLDDRRVFNDHLIERDMLLVKDWQQEIKELIFLFFFSCREALQTQFPKIYKNRLKKKGGKSASWADIILQQAREEKKEAEQIAERNLLLFLRQRELDIEDAEYQQDEMEKITNKNKRN